MAMRLPEPLPAHISELRRRVRVGGLRALLAFLTAGVRAQLIKRETLLVIAKRLDEHTIAIPARRADVRLEPLERRHEPALRALNRERGDIEADARFATDFDAGYGGFAGFRGDELIACYWWTDGSMPEHRDMRELGLAIPLGPHDVYGFDLYVHQQHRAGGTANEILYQVETALRERGFERLWGWVVADNRSARWTYEARGYEPTWTVERTRVLRRWRNRIAIRRESQRRESRWLDERRHGRRAVPPPGGVDRERSRADLA
jgi:GNAT superfamily N-acetyltransferase